ncbi:hypothetical protein Q9S36_24615 [Microbacterium sp. ARD31]|uniref:hypothetical protein n=1 Tax=Microbacterium sp. ARD31 TaxID=2962576 RepID=UPI0028823A7C|nr:hypothetical protein [Microbacterium sp. ARD31]MDT0183375.1 hypothetical protein [Microbacterium sp. ARD31]
MRFSPRGWLARETTVWAVLCSLIAVGEAGVLLLAARHGFDFTDEGFYLNSIGRDSEGSTHVSSFGQVFRPVNAALGADVVAVRWFNILVVLLAGSVLGWALMSRGGEAARGRSAAVLAVAASTLGFFGTGLLSPSYNSLAAIGVLVVGSGLVLSADRESTRGRTRAAALLVGLGGLATLLGKPSAAMAVAVVAGLGLLVVGPVGRRVAVMAAAVAGIGLVLTSWVLTGSPIGLVERLQRAVADARGMEAGHDLGSALSQFGMPATSSWALLVSLVLATATFTWSRGWLSSGRRKAAWLLVSAAATAYVAYSFIGQVEALSYATPTRALVILSASVGVILAGLTTGRRPDLPSSVLAVTLCLLPHAWAFGSNNDYWHGGSLLYVLWFAAGVVLLRGQRGADPAAPAIGTTVPMLLLTAAVIASVVTNPYRQVVPTFDQETATRVGPSATLRLAPDFARAIDGFREAAYGAGFTAGTPVLDLTGQMPGLVFAIEGRAAGAPWIIGGYPGSDDVARRTVSRTSCSTLAEAWLIQEPAGTRQIDPAVLSELGASLDDWTPVTSQTFTTIPGTERSVTLLRPTSSPEDRLAECEAARG